MPRNSSYQPEPPSSIYQIYGSVPSGLMQGSFGNSVPLTQTKSPFLATLNLSDLTRLTNDPIHRQPRCLVIPTKVPSDIPKFYGNLGEYPSTHVMTYHLWCSSNSFNYDSIRLGLFQCTFIETTAKWYVEFPRASFHDFYTLEMELLMHF